MPLFRDGLATAPDWCELKSFAIVKLPAGATHDFPRTKLRQRLLVAAGSCRVAYDDQQVEAGEGTKCELPGGDGHFAVLEVSEPAVVIHLCGTWGDETGGWALFRVEEIADPVERGDPVPYPKRTRIDNHYHDCDECSYIILTGRGTVVSEGRHYADRPGDCVLTGMGDHHDFPLAPEPVHAVFFETTSAANAAAATSGNTHGKAVPQRR